MSSKPKRNLAEEAKEAMQLTGKYVFRQTGFQTSGLEQSIFKKVQHIASAISAVFLIINKMHYFKSI